MKVESPPIAQTPQPKKKHSSAHNKIEEKKSPPAPKEKIDIQTTPPKEKEQTQTVKEKKEIKRIEVHSKKGTLKKPALFFVRGFQSLSLSTDYDGLVKMAEVIPGARLYEWDQRDEMLNEIEKRSPEQKIILIGHSFGGDTAVEMANELNSLEKGFRSIDLLVTIDSVGFNNDIIPANVKKNLNFFGESSFFFNDGPNVAREVDRTLVYNELRKEEHDQIDNATDVQRKILESVALGLGHKQLDLKA